MSQDGVEDNFTRLTILATVTVHALMLSRLNQLNIDASYFSVPKCLSYHFLQYCTFRLSNLQVVHHNQHLVCGY